MIVNHVTDPKMHRESTYKHTQCTTTQAEKTYRESLLLNTPQGEIPSYTGHNARQLQQKFNKDIRNQVRDRTRSAQNQKHLAHVKRLQAQGHMLTLASAKQQDVLWKSQMFQLKSGTLKFMINASIDTLPTQANLKRWKYTTSDKCKL